MTDLGAEQFTGKEKKAYEARKIVDRGGRVSSLCGLVREREANTAVGRMAVSSRKMVCFCFIYRTYVCGSAPVAVVGLAGCCLCCSMKGYRYQF